MMIAIYAISNAATKLGNTESVSVFDIEEAADFVAERLPEEIDARLDRPTVISIIRWQLDYMRERGLATYGWADGVAEGAAVGGKGPVVADEDEMVDAVLAEAAASGVEVDALDVVVVLDLTAQYLQAIGAVGSAVTEPVDPEGPGDPSS